MMAKTLSEIVSGTQIPVLAGVALLLFISVFSWMLFWVFRKGSAPIYRSLSEIPFDQEGNDYK